jgi:hypothetical protein
MGVGSRAGFGKTHGYAALDQQSGKVFGYRT